MVLDQGRVVITDTAIVRKHLEESIRLDKKKLSYATHVVLDIRGHLKKHGEKFLIFEFLSVFSLIHVGYPRTN